MSFDLSDDNSHPNRTIEKLQLYKFYEKFNLVLEFPRIVCKKVNEAIYIFNVRKQQFSGTFYL